MNTTPTNESPAPQADSLVARIDALLDLDASGSLVPHGIGGLARELLLECRERLSCG